MALPPAGTIFIYRGLQVAWIADDRMAEVDIVHVAGTAASVPVVVQEPSQMPLMVLPEHVARRAKMRGHAAPPGSGPDGETCGTCASLVMNHSRSDKTFRKCGLMRAEWSKGGGTDVRKKDMACGKWSVK